METTEAEKMDDPEKTGELREVGRERTLETLTNAVEDATRGAAAEAALRWSAVALWSAACVGVLFAVGVGGGLDRSTSVRIAWFSCGCALFFGVAGAARAFRRRPSLFQAARRWERRFPEIAGILTAAVDFAREGDVDASTSAALRRATIETAARRLERTARTLDAAERRALLADVPVERFRKMGKTGVALALGVAGCLGVWGGLRCWGETDGLGKTEREAKDPAARSETLAIERDGSGGSDEDATNGENDENEKNGGNKENEEGKEDGENAENGRNGEDENADIAVETDAEVSVATLELLSGELARNVEIARTLETALENVASGRSPGDAAANETPEEAATSFLFLARELKTSFERPERGVWAQVRRLLAAARREKTRGLAEFEKMKKREEIEEVDESGKTGKLGEIGKERRNETAAFLLTARLERWETNRLRNASGYDAATSALNVVLRSDSETERTRAATAAARDVERWTDWLRREEAAIRILTESWRFEAAEKAVDAALADVAEENRALLARFAGRSAFEPDANSGDLNEREFGKRRVAASLEAAKAATNEKIAIFERLRERLRSDEGAEFVAFVEETAAIGNDGREDAADRAARAAVDDWASRWEKKRNAVAENVVAERFGRAASALREPVESARIVGKEENENGENGESSAEETRFAALAFRLTFGDEPALRQATTENEETLAVSRVALEKTSFGESGATARKNGEPDAETEPLEPSFDAPNGEENASAVVSSEVANADESASWSGETTGENDADSGALNGVRNGDEAGETVGGGVGGALNGENASGVGTGGAAAENERGNGWEVVVDEAFSGELPSEARRRIDGADAPSVAPEYEEKTRLYRRRVANERRR